MMANVPAKAKSGFRQEMPIDSIIAAISTIERYAYPFGALIWAVVFAVKFCYLHFFRLLIDRQQPLVTYWKVTMAVTVVATVFNTCASFESCPKFGDQVCKSLCYNYIACVFVDLNVHSEM